MANVRPGSPLVCLAGQTLCSRPSSAVSNSRGADCVRAKGLSPLAAAGYADSARSGVNAEVIECLASLASSEARVANSFDSEVGPPVPNLESACSASSENLISGKPNPGTEVADTLARFGVTVAASASSSTKGRRKKSKSSQFGLKVNTVGCNGKSAKDCYAMVCEELGWQEVDVEPRASVSGQVTKKDNTIFCVTQTNEMLDRLPRLGKNSWVSRYVGCPELCDKGNFARMCCAVRDFCDPADLAFNPPTWVLPDQTAELKAKLLKSKKTYIVKPEDGSQGDGIFLIRGIRDLEAKLMGSGAAVVQRYIEKPLLLAGVKFDLRMYVCLIGGSEESPPQTFLCKEGLARFCTEKYEEPAHSNMHKCMGHLTNYSLNKRSDKFEHAGETLESVFDPKSTASKRPLTAALTQMESECSGFEREMFYTRVAALVQKAVALMAPALTSYSRTHAGSGGMRSFQILGFDVILGSDFTPYLLEINNSPSLCIDEALPLNYEQLSPEERALPISRAKEKDKVCRCMDMAQPHYHQTALVDVVVKKVAVGGAFVLLERIKEGSSDPEHDDYIPIDISSDPLYEMLASVEAFFHRCGGAQKAFTGAALRRNLGNACGRGGLQKHDLDTLSQKFRFSRYATHDPSARAEALRMFDFMELLRQAGARAFPEAGPADAVARMIEAS
eukprot:TRINITY_DN31407_c0_g1_i1.p1 TRINITY_DN31407_c0_g1~~TRINITY_DN31407_c0_g1_i1.p1  ORF type:complete len:688 (-),score=67.96 TRINITY_DN31407_c0_g1_i1:160-2181(-)